MDKQLEWWWSALLSSSGLATSIGYLVWSRRRRGRIEGSGLGEDSNPFLVQDRPWRRLGAVICAVVSAMFFVGVNVLDSHREPGVYLVYWIVVFLLLLWLCLLVGIDVLRTHRLRLELDRLVESSTLPTRDRGPGESPPEIEDSL